MNEQSHLQRLFDHDTWATHALFSFLGAAEEAPGRAIQILAHIISAEFLWFARLQGETSEVPVWPDWSLDECEEEFGVLPAAWAAYLASIDVAELTRVVSYTNSKGQTWESTVSDILTHVTAHATYHRGQIALVLREAGLNPPNTDFIHGSRQRLF